jgi:hypothetical protein
LPHTSASIPAEDYSNASRPYLSPFNTKISLPDERSHSIIVAEHIQTCAAAARSYIRWLLSLEDPLFTINLDNWANYRDQFYHYYKSVYNTTHTGGLGAIFHAFDLESATQEFQDSMNGILRGLNTFGLSNLAPVDLAKLVPPSDQEPALKVMAEVRAYYQGSLSADRPPRG